MDFLTFELTVILVSASGVLSPGPLFFADLICGSKYGYKAGLKCSYGHTVVELPLIILLAFGVITLRVFPAFNMTVSVIGGITLLIFAGFQVRFVIRKKYQSVMRASHGPLLVGIIFSALNPFFIIWWLTVGMKLITDSLLLASIYGLVFMFLTHIWMDYTWLTSVAHFAKKGVDILGSRSFLILLVALSGTLVYFGINFIIQGLKF